MAKAARKTVRMVRSSGNVFADLDLPNAAELDTKARLMFAANNVLVSRKLTRARAAALLGINQSAMSALRSHRIDGFSVERLMGFLTALGCDIEIRITRPRRLTARPGRIRLASPLP
jgi:predicted XRE-type DNA-binding protein